MSSKSPSDDRRADTEQKIVILQLREALRKDRVKPMLEPTDAPEDKITNMQIVCGFRSHEPLRNVCRIREAIKHAAKLASGQ